MASYNDIIATDSAWTPLAIAAEVTNIYATAPIRLTSHTSPDGNTIGIPLDRNQAYQIGADTDLRVKADSPQSAIVVRVTA